MCDLGVFWLILIYFTGSDPEMDPGTTKSITKVDGTYLNYILTKFGGCKLTYVVTAKPQWLKIHLFGQIHNPFQLVSLIKWHVMQKCI